MHLSPLTLPLLVATCLLLLAAAAHDVAVRTVPNLIPALLLAAGAILRLDDHTFFVSLGAAACVFTVTTFCWLRGWMGGGDVKLYAACSMIVPPALVLPFIFASALAGGVLAVCYLSLRGLLPRRHSGPRPEGLFARLMRCERRRIGRGGPLPYAAAIALGAIFTLAST